MASPLFPCTGRTRGCQLARSQSGTCHISRWGRKLRSRMSAGTLHRRWGSCQEGKESSGRTTLLKLMQGEIEPTAGRITVDDVSTLFPQFASIRRHVAYVGAVPAIFSGTIMENLTMFGPEKRDFARKMAQLFGPLATRLPDKQPHRTPKNH